MKHFGRLCAVSAARLPWATRGDIATATKALASRGHCCQRRGWARERLARHVGALAPVCQ